MRERMLFARRRQERRGSSSWRTNAEISDELVGATPEARSLLGGAVEGLGLSARRVLRVGHTIADLAGEKRAGAIAEALGYRDDWTEGLGGRLKTGHSWTLQERRKVTSRTMLSSP